MNSQAISIRLEQEKLYYSDPKRELLTWLYAVQTHAIAGSRESRATLVKLSQCTPEYRFASIEIQGGVKKIIQLAGEKRWNPNLASLSSVMYHDVSQLKEYSDSDFVNSIKAIFESNRNIENICEDALRLFEYFVSCKANPNLSFPKITVGNNIYTNPNCFHIVYILWKYPEAEWNDDQNERFSRIIDGMLKNEIKVNLLAQFSETKLSVVNKDREKFKKFYQNENKRDFTQHRWQARNSPNISAYPPLLTRSGDREFERKKIKQKINGLEGHTFEQMTIAHFAIICNDYSTLNKILKLEHSLLHEACCMTKGKSSLGERMIIQTTEGSIVRSDFISISPYAPTDCRSKLFRTSNVTLLHLAARVGSREIFACLQMKANPAVKDSNGQIPRDYLQRSILEKIVVEDRKEMLRGLDPNIKICSAMPKVNLRFHHEGYDLLYNTSRRIAYYSYQKLYKNSVFEIVSRPKPDPWHDEPKISILNRPKGKKPYSSTRSDRGYFAPAEDQSSPLQAMWASFYTENQAPQHKNLNRGFWKDLEKYIRVNLTKTHDLIEIFTGPLFNPKVHRMIGDVIVPSHFFKILYLHNRRSTSKWVVIASNAENAPNSIYIYRSDQEADALINTIQRYSGILFSEWRK